LEVDAGDELVVSGEVPDIHVDLWMVRRELEAGVRSTAACVARVRHMGSACWLSDGTVAGIESDECAANMLSENVSCKVYKVGMRVSSWLRFGGAGWYIGAHGASLCIQTRIPDRRPAGTERTRSVGTTVTPRNGHDREPQPPKKKRPGRGGSSDRVYDHLRDLIVWGRLAPGSRIVENDIAVHLDVSRTPIRSALHRLRQEGYIVPSGRRKEHRLVIAPLTQNDARELFDLVGMVEGLAAGAAASLSPAERGVLGDDLTALNAELDQASRDGKNTARHLFDADMKFHRRYVEAGAGPRLITLHDAIKPQAERYIHLYTNSLLGEIGRSVEEHEAIIERIVGGSADGARRAVQRNWRNAAERLERVIAVMGEHGSW
jgi:DNA-binding GntR family transcriptional regulator